MRRRVVVTALDMMTALGLDRQAAWDRLVAGESGVGRISLFDASLCATQIAAELPDGFLEQARRHCSRRQIKQMARATLMGVACAKSAIEQDGIDPQQYDPARCAAVFGVADTGHAHADGDEFWILKTMLHSIPALLAIEYDLQGPCFVQSAACASSAHAMAAGFDLVANDQADLVIVGGASSIINEEHVRGFNELRALSTNNDDPTGASCPFSVDRDGFVMGEGAGVLVLEERTAAEQRGATIHAELSGYGLTNEAFNLMGPRPEGAGMAQSMQTALNHAGVEPSEVDYINAHGTSTVQNDSLETQAIKTVFGGRAYDIPVSSSKSMLGHAAGACGAIEAVITILTLQQGIITPTINYTPDPALDLDYVPDESRDVLVRTALSNSFGFGGCNGTLVFRRE